MKIRIVYLIACMMLAASMPSALAVISYGGANVEVPVLSPGLAEGDSNALNDWTGAVGFGGYTAGPANIVVDPFGNNYAKFAHAWVFVGAYGATAGAYAEWMGAKEASAYDVVNTGAAAGTYTMKAKVDGQAIATVSNNPLVPTGAYAESLIDAFAGETTGPRQLWGNAQITSTVFHDGLGTATTGTTKRNTVGETQPSATAAFAAERAINYGGQVGIPAKLLGTVKGVTSLEAENNANVAGTSTGSAYGYSTINTQAWTDAIDNGYQSFTQSEIRTDTLAARTLGAASRESSVTGYASGEASSQAWDPSADWFGVKVPGSESASSAVSGKTISSSEAYTVGDSTFGFISPAVRAQIIAAAGDETDVFQNFLSDGRDAMAATLTDAYVFRANSITDRVGAETFIENGNAASSGKNAIQVDQAVSTALTGVQQSSGGHAISATFTNAFGIQGSTAGMVARATFDPSLGGANFVTLGDVNGVLSPFSHSGLSTIGPSWTTERWDDAGSYITAQSQSAISTSSAGTYSITADPVEVTEWVAGNDPLNNMYITTPISIQTAMPMNGLITPVDNPIQRARTIPEYYGWSGAVFGDQ